ncbi:MAG: phage terminase large subunit [Rhodospirillaceae bacterium]|jgi:predicted phage terminase large subunit-like protein|nr:phage terminase large subunit [Rhodospirillaceae bacterium]MBT6118167.1 phage terminase large subunit [Rhodospirillaceae bacterium]
MTNSIFGVPPGELAISPAVINEICRADFHTFGMMAFQELHGTGIIDPNWHLEVLAHYLQEASEGKITRLAIALPPRYMKSHFASVALPAFILGHDPTAKIICASYGIDLAEGFSRQTRRLMESTRYKRIFTRASLAREKNTQSEFWTTKGGFRLATSVGGPLTGRGGMFAIIDDPSKPLEMLMESARNMTNIWFDGTLYSRLDNKAKGVIIIVMQRQHEDDLIGHVLEKDGWTYLRIPAIADEDMTYRLGYGRVYERREGEVLHPAREAQEDLAKTASVLGRYDYAAQYQQAPLSVEGNLVRWTWFQFFENVPPRESVQRIIQSWDTANKDSDTSDYSVCTTWYEIDKKVYLVDVLRQRLDFPALERQVVALAREREANLVLIEDAGAGTTLLQTLRASRINTIGITPDTNKVTRMKIASSPIEAGKVMLPVNAPWLEEFQREVLQFPHGRFDDQVDSLSQFLGWWDRSQAEVIPLVGPCSITRRNPWRI